MVVEDIENIRIDKYLLDHTNYSRSQIQNLIKTQHILVNGNLVKSSYKVKIGDKIVIKEVEETKILPENIPLDIIYEDDDIIVVDKPNNMVVHPASNLKSGTLVNALMYHTKDLSDINGEERPGIVHRLDADTTGLMVVAKNNEAHKKIAKQLEKRTMVRKYYALVSGVINETSGTIDAPIKRDEKDRKKMSVASGGKKAITHFKVLERYDNATLLECELVTGRTHQIRVHLAYIGKPIINDSVYNNKKPINNDGQCLHSCMVGFIHPTTNEYVEYYSPLPDKIKKIIKLL